MKDRKLALLALLLAASMLLSGCGEVTNAVTRPSQGGVVTVPGPGVQDDNPFTVTLKYQGVTYPPSPENPITIQWNDGYSMHTAPLEADGIARMGGLDGDYKVTLLNLPNGYTYNPNIYVATNDKRHVEIELYKLIPTTGKGTDPYNCITVSNTGLYCVEVNSADHETFFEFAPKESGTYSVESWMDTTADEVDVNANYYGANAFYKPLVSTHESGGAEGTYTKNVKMDVQIADENISADGGAASFTFGITATQKSGKYPIKVYIAISLDGDFSYPYVAEPLFYPQELPSKEVYDPQNDPNVLSGKTFVWADTLKTNGDASASVFDERLFKLWPESEGGDGFYHVYDVNAYPTTKGYGPVLYAKISQASRFIEALSTIEYAGNKALTVWVGEERRNYKYFIEGWDSLVSFDPNPNGKPSYFCTKFCPCREGGCDSFDVVGVAGACEEGCPNCHPECRHIPKDKMGLKGYADLCNAHGAVPVTQELQIFLQALCINEQLFMDGQGFAETHPQFPVFSGENDQWLFVCGYYVS